MFEKYVSDLNEFKSAYSTGDVGDILIAGGKLVTDSGEIVNLFDGNNVGKSETLDEDTKAEGKTAVEEIKALCCNADGTVKSSKVKAKAGATGKFGDGVIFGKFMDALPAILAIFGKFFGG